MKKLFILAAVAASFASCSFDKDMGESASTAQEKIPLYIGTTTGSATVQSATRSSKTTLQDDYAVANATSGVYMGLYILDQGKTTSQTGASAYEKFNLKTAASSGIVEDDPSSKYSKLGFGSTLYYPDIKTKGIDVYVYAPINETASEFPSSSDDIITTPIKLTTQTTQTYNADYYANDFLWGCVGEGVPDAAQTTITTLATSAKVKTGVAINASNAKAATPPNGYVLKVANNNYILVPMIHLGSKIIVKIKTNASMPIIKLKGATVKFRTDKQTADLNLSTGALSNLGGTNQTAITIGKLGYSASGTPMTTTTDKTGLEGIAWTDGDADDTIDDGEITAYYCAGVILPQTVSSFASGLIEITLSDETTVYLYKPDAAPTFAGGKKYTYEITVKASGLNVTTSVENWASDTWGTTADPKTGDANLN